MSSNEFIHFESIDSMPQADIELVAQAREATAKAYAPYSGFRVGAAARLRSGRIVQGSNQESEVYPAGLCAERTLLYYIGSQYGDDPVESVAIASQPDRRECTPCGQCRQVLLDMERRQGSPIRIVMSSATTATVSLSAEALLPLSFKLVVSGAKRHSE